MIRVGIIGSENSHSLHFAQLINVEKKIDGAEAVMLWGEEPEHTTKVAQQTQIPKIVDSPEDMIGKIDVAIIVHRHAKYHVPAATPLVKAGIPVLIDKPYSWTVEEGRELLKTAEEKNVLVTSYSCVRYSDGFVKDKKAIEEMGKLYSVDYYGPCDINSPYGGIFFYGIHQVEMMASQLGIDVEAVQFNKGPEEDHTATVYYKKGNPIVTLHFIKNHKSGFRYTVVSENGMEHIPLDHSGLYEKGLKAFFRMVETGKNDFSEEELLTPVAVLEAMAKSIKSGQKEPVKI